MGNYCCDCLFGSNDHNHYYESLTSQEVTQLRSGRSREISLDNYQSIIDQASSNFINSKYLSKTNNGLTYSAADIEIIRSKLGDANVNASIVSTPPNNGLLINLKQSQAGYNYYTNSTTNAGSSNIGSISSIGNIGVNVKGISSDLTKGSSTTNVAASAAVNTTTTTTTTTTISAIDTNKNASLIQSIETIADDVYKTISNNINKNHAFSSIKNNRSNINIISSDATVVSFKPFEDSSCIIHT